MTTQRVTYLNSNAAGNRNKNHPNRRIRQLIIPSDRLFDANSQALASNDW